MIRVLLGNLFQSEAQTWVNTVNCVGIMGKGVALEFKKRFPDMFTDYEARCRAGEVRLGRPYLYKRLVERWILNFPTKQHWRQVTNLRDVIAGLDTTRNGASRRSRCPRLAAEMASSNGGSSARLSTAIFNG